MKRTIYQYACLLISLLMTGVFWLGIFLTSQTAGDLTSSIVLTVITVLILVAAYFVIDAPVRGLYGVNWYIHLVAILMIPVRLFLQIVTIVCMHTCNDDYFGERKDYESHRLLSSLMYALFTASSLSFSGWASSDRAARHRHRGYEKKARKSKFKFSFGAIWEAILELLESLWSAILHFVKHFVIPAIIVLAVLAALLLLPDYHADVSMWRWSGLDRLLFVLFSVISSAILIIDMYTDNDVPTLWIFCFLSTALTVSFLEPQGALSAALAFYGNIFFIVYSLYFLIFVGIFHFSSDVDELAKKVVTVISGATLLISSVLAYILAPQGIYLPNRLNVLINETEIPIPLMICGVFMLIAMLFDKSNVHINVEGSSGSKKAGLVQMEEAAKAAASAVPYVEFGSVSSGTVTLYVSVSGYQATKQEEWFMKELRSSLGGLSTSGWNFHFLHK